MTIVSTDNADHYRWGEGCDGWHLARTAGLSVIQEQVPPGCAEVRHYHEHAEQFFFVLAGTATLEVEGHAHRLESGQGLHVAAGVAHRLSNQDGQALWFLVVSAPPSHGDRVEAQPLSGT